MTPMRAIRAKCLDCVCGSPQEVRLCPSQNCPLYPYRTGHRPKGYKDTTADTAGEKTADSPAFLSKDGQ